ncbi:M48 family metallopeptidase [Asticcacaulis sp. YBE204]|uniref:M48 family metallopeptidase n=1 Tax=Asticcacaulis sp. YBE204 TaxID=1282363 RepID=UPI0003C3D91B|nr:M48 family metallopeptidase [Asticcacaulis sp. YBE204]ESQ80047.1 hypothetical protein AEYBE204_05365 [Asticcacaulis sp. YBE204]
MPRKAIEIPTSRAPWGWGTAIEDRYRPMIARLETLSRDKPGAYRRRVLLGAMLGYAYLAVVLGGLLVLTVALVVVAFATSLALVLGQVVIAFLVMGFDVLRALRVKFEPPKGIPVKKRDAPALYAMLKDIRRKTRGPRISKVLITEDFNAAIMQMPRLGVFGWHRNYLLLGLPFLMAMDEHEVRAVVAHEYGHLVGAHGKLSAWVYRVRQTWARLSYAFDGGGMGFVLKRFFRWYGPWFNAYSFVLARANEYEADRVSARVAGSHTAACALARTSVEGHRYEQHWQALMAHNRVAETPAAGPYTALALRFAEPFEIADRARILSGALRETTDIHNTHPCLSDRLTALGEALPDLGPVERSGATAFLGEALIGRLTERLDTEWWGAVASIWQENFRQAELMRARRRELDGLATQGPLDESLYWERVNLLETEGEVATAHALAETWAEAHPERLDVRGRVAQFYLDQGDRKGLGLLQTLRDSGERRHRLTALQTLAAYYVRFDPDSPELPLVFEALAEAERFEAAIETFLARVLPEGHIEAADLPDTAIAALKRALDMNSRIRSLWVGRRTMPEDPSVAQYIVLFVSRNRREGAFARETFMDDVLKILEALGAVMVLENDRDRDWLRKRLMKIKGTEVRRDRKR